MKHSHLSVSIILLLLLAQINACKKDIPQPSKNDLFSKTWKTVALYANGQNITAFVPSCTKDDFFIFTKDGKYTVDEGPTKCNASDPQVNETGTWVFQDNETKFKIISSTGDSLLYSITELTSSELKVTYTMQSNVVPISYAATLTPL